MKITIQLTLVAIAACLCVADGAPENRLARTKQRPTRGFKNVEMMTARGFGKRDRPSSPRTERYGADTLWSSLATERDVQDSDEKNEVGSFPLDWFVNELIENPDLARIVVRKFIDLNQDGMLTPAELLRNVIE